MRAALYIRVSSEEQVLHGFSLDAQEQALTDYVKEHNHDIVGIYRDEGVSARKPYTKRPELLRLLQDVDKGKIDLILFIKLDRWFRNIKEYYKVQEHLDKAHVSWSAILEDYSTLTADGRLKVNIMLSVAENEADRTAERINFINAMKIKEGKPVTGNPPFGYCVKVIDGKKTIAIDEANGPIMQEAFDLYLHNMSINKVYLELKKKHNAASDIATWSKRFRSPYYYGQYRDNPNYFPPLISKEKWDRVQELLSRNIKFAPSGQVYLFTGLMKCPICGSAMHAGYSTQMCGGVKIERYKRITKSYRCSKYVHSRNCPNNHRINELKIEKYLLSEIKPHIESKIYEVRKKNKSIKKEEPDKYKKQLERLNKVYIEGNIEEQEYIKRGNEIKKKIRELSVPEHSQDLEKSLAIFKGDFDAIYSNMNDAQKRAFWQTLIQSIELELQGNFLMPTNIVLT